MARAGQCNVEEAQVFPQAVAIGQRKLGFVKVQTQMPVALLICQIDE
jgi:hypothetical protein